MVKRLNERKRSMKESYASEKEQLDRINYMLDKVVEVMSDFASLCQDARIDDDLLDEIIVEDYPFDKSLDEACLDIADWAYDSASKAREKLWDLGVR